VGAEHAGTTLDCGTLLIDGGPVRFARRSGRPTAHRIETATEEVPIPEHLVA
jgi:hypothetical protein